MPLFLTDNFSRFFSFCKKHKRSSLLFILPLLSISVFIINPSFAAVNNTKEPVVTITAKNEPLKKVLDKISKATGYKIEVTEGWENKPITVDIKAMTLDDSLKKIIRALGSPSTTTVDHNREKVVKIDFVDSLKVVSSMKNENISHLQMKQAEAVLNNTDGFPSITETYPTSDNMSELNPLAMEVLPPDTPGQKGITFGELQSGLDKKQKNNSLDEELIPPDKPGENGITVDEIQATKFVQGKRDSSDLEVLPPDKPGEKGMTLDEIQKIRDKHGNPEDEVEIPSDKFE